MAMKGGAKDRDSCEHRFQLASISSSMIETVFVAKKIIDEEAL